MEISQGSAVWNTSWNEISEIGKNQGFNLGGDWKKSNDRPHFEMSFGNSTKSLS